MQYFLFITNYKNWGVVKSRGIFGVIDYHKNKYNLIREGDYIIFYITQIKEFGGIIFKVHKKFTSNEKIFDNAYDSYLLRLQLNREFTGKNKKIDDILIKNLKFLKNKSKWGGSLQGKPIIKIDKTD